MLIWTVLTVWCLPACPVCTYARGLNGHSVRPNTQKTVRNDVPSSTTTIAFIHRSYVFWKWFRFSCDSLWRAKFSNDPQNNDQLLRFKRVLSLQLFLSAFCVTFGNARSSLTNSTELCLCVIEDEERLSYCSSKVNVTSHRKTLHPFLLMLLMQPAVDGQIWFNFVFRLSSFLSVNFQESYN